MTLVELLPSLGGLARARLEDGRWPADAHVSPTGDVVVGGVALAGLAGAFGTPVHVVSEQEVRRVSGAYARVLPRVVVSPAELPWPDVLRWCAEEGLVVADAPGLRGHGLRYRLSGDVPAAERCARDVVRLVARLRHEHGVELDEVVVEVVAGEAGAFDLTGLATRLRVAVNGEALTHRVPPPRLTVEPGRSLLVRAVVGVGRVRSVRAGAVEVDGPVGPVMRVLARPSSAVARDHAVVGPFGEATRVSLPADVRAGDLLAVPCAGGRPRAPLFAVAGGERRLLPKTTAGR
ncbi:hypothetical protein ACWEFJ_16295 [Actinosynnema sp. NPDC004786]